MAPPLTKKQEDYLNDLYYNQHFYFGRDRIFARAKEDKTKISERQIMAWLKNQEIHQLYTRSYKTKNIKSTVLDEPNKQIGVDLIDFSMIEYNNYKYIFTCIDLFTKKAYAYPLKTKDEAYIGLLDLLNDVNDRIASIRSDNGTEFKGKFTEILNEQGINQVFSLPSKPQSNGNIERFNCTLKKLIRMYLKVNNTYNWVDILPELINNYNNSLNSTTNKIPNEITTKDYEEVKNNISDKVLKERNQDVIKFNVGDKVRIKLKEPNDFGEIWSKDVYIIDKVNKPKSRLSSVCYILVNDNQHYYNNDLLLIKEINNKLKEEELFEVSKLIRPCVEKGIQYYEVKWKNYSSKFNTLEPRDELILDIPKLIKRFEKQHNVKWSSKSVSWS